MPTWLIVIFAISGGGIGLVGFYKTVLSPIARNLTYAEDSWPTLVSIAREFKRNGGSTLRDEIDSISHRLDDVEAAAKLAAITAQETQIIIEAHERARIIRRKRQTAERRRG